MEKEITKEEQVKEKPIRNRFAKLIDVKSIVTLILTAVFAYLAVKKIISGQEFLTVFAIIIAFYFGTQAKKTSES